PLLIESVIRKRGHDVKKVEGQRRFLQYAGPYGGPLTILGKCIFDDTKQEQIDLRIHRVLGIIRWRIEGDRKQPTWLLLLLQQVVQRLCNITDDSRGAHGLYPN